MRPSIILLGLVFMVGGGAALLAPGPAAFSTGRFWTTTELTSGQKKIFGIASLTIGAAVIVGGLASKKTGKSRI